MDDSNIKNNNFSSTKRNLRNISRSFFLLLPIVIFLLFFMGASYSEVIPIKVTPIVSGIITMVIGLFFFLKILLDLRRLTKDLSGFINKKDRSKLMKPGNNRVLISIQLFLIVIIGAYVFLEIFYLVNDYARIGFPLTRLIITSSALLFSVLLLGLSVVKKQYSNDNNNLFDEESYYVTENLYNQVNKVWLGLKVFIGFGVLYIFNVLIIVSSSVT